MAKKAVLMRAECGLLLVAMCLLGSGCRSGAKRDVARVEPTIGPARSGGTQYAGGLFYTFPPPAAAPAAAPAVVAAPVAAAPVAAAPAAMVAPMPAPPVVAPPVAMATSWPGPVPTAGAPPFYMPTTGSTFQPAGVAPVVAPPVMPVAPMAALPLRLQPQPDAGAAAPQFLGDVQPAGLRLSPRASGMGQVQRADLTSPAPRPLDVAPPPARSNPPIVPSQPRGPVPPPPSDEDLPQPARPRTLEIPPPPPPSSRPSAPLKKAEPPTSPPAVKKEANLDREGPSPLLPAPSGSE